jgi:hypothetical protein
MEKRYAATRLTFKREVIEALSDGDSFEVDTPEGVFRMTKGQFHESFPGAANSSSYRDGGLYTYARTPVRARAFLTPASVSEGRPGGQSLAPMLSGDEPLHKDATPIDRTVRDFWRWAKSDLLSNALRGCLAEYLVAVSLGVDDKPRREWVAWDLTSPDGLRVEVKSSAYVQSWFQRRPSTIAFRIGQTAGWDPNTAESGTEKKRQADVYVFALLSQVDRQLVDPLDVDQWRFFVVACADLNQHCEKQVDIRLSRLRMLPHAEVSFEGLAEAVRTVGLRNSGCDTTTQEAPGL